MDLSDPVQRRVYFEIFEHIPRQGPGSPASTRRALGACQIVPPVPQILDLGAGSGAQSLVLAQAFPKGHVTAIDNHPAYITRMKGEVALRGLYEHLLPLCANMDHFPFMPGHCDLVWCENAVQALGLEKALPQWKRYAKTGGYIGFSMPVWLTETPSPELAQWMKVRVPDMDTTDRINLALKAEGLQLETQFLLPNDDWWTSFCTPMRDLALLSRQHRYSKNPVALAVLNEMLFEVTLRERFADEYAIAFTVARKPA